MYIWGFLKSLFTPRKIPSALYFLANQALVFFVFYFIGMGVGAEKPAAWGGIGIALNLLAILAMLSPLGEAIVRYREKAKPLNKSEFSYTYSLFEDICDEARRVNPKLPKNIKLYVMNDKSINAAATGCKTVILTLGMLYLVEDGTISRSEFKAVIAHELGHISHSDTSLSLGIYVSTGLLQLVLCLYVFIINSIGSLLYIILPILGRIFILVFGRTVTFLFDVWSKIGVLLTNATSRQDEYQADDFAGKCGYAYELCHFLQRLDSSNTKSYGLSILLQSHPDTVDRVDRLQKNYR